ncbi:hypothetical protein METSCH_B01980 [Metschnikowia aff. pulcherrima]|uniref:Uncharacterized protein n=1 Tax=Metschnikowia aff. pulcherrima TaxID=2163413 RepID=A0A4P6XMZ2_9ASCO|nr:hypothetical protein METSCH_B01980 [Metschnikowia aff. pulcherrima]
MVFVLQSTATVALIAIVATWVFERLAPRLTFTKSIPGSVPGVNRILLAFGVRGQHLTSLQNTFKRSAQAQRNMPSRVVDMFHEQIDELVFRHLGRLNLVEFPQVFKHHNDLEHSGLCRDRLELVQDRTSPFSIWNHKSFFEPIDELLHGVKISLLPLMFSQPARDTNDVVNAKADFLSLRHLGFSVEVTLGRLQKSSCIFIPLLNSAMGLRVKQTDRLGRRIHRHLCIH